MESGNRNRTTARYPIHINARSIAGHSHAHKVAIHGLQIHQVQRSSSQTAPHQNRILIRSLCPRRNRIDINRHEERLRPVQCSRQCNLFLSRKRESRTRPCRSQRARTQRSVIAVAAAVSQNSTRALQKVIVRSRTCRQSRTTRTNSHALRSTARRRRPRPILPQIPRRSRRCSRIRHSTCSMSAA